MTVHRELPRRLRDDAASEFHASWVIVAGYEKPGSSSKNHGNNTAPSALDGAYGTIGTTGTEGITPRRENGRRDTINRKGSGVVFHVGVESHRPAKTHDADMENDSRPLAVQARWHIRHDWNDWYRRRSRAGTLRGGAATWRNGHSWRRWHSTRQDCPSHVIGCARQ